VTLFVPIDRLTEQLFLVAEGGIKARRIDPHCIRKVADTRALKTLAPENIERSVKRLVFAKASRTARSHDFISFQGTDP
jgi:hypothetical protein